MDSDGFVHVADTSNHRFVKSTATGGCVDTWGHFLPSDHDDWDYEFDTPFGIAVDRRGNVYIADCKNARIQQWTSGGVFVPRGPAWESTAVNSPRRRASRSISRGKYSSPMAGTVKSWGSAALRWTPTATCTSSTH